MQTLKQCILYYVCFRVCFLSKRCVTVTKWIIITVCNTSHHVWLKQSLFMHTLYLCYSYPYLTNRLHTDTQSSYTSIAQRWTNTHKVHISHTLMALDLIFLLLSIYGERHNTLKRGRETLFPWWNEKLMLQWFVKASTGSTVGQTTGGFFFPCFFSNYMVEQRSIRRERGWY